MYIRIKIFALQHITITHQHCTALHCHHNFSKHPEAELSTSKHPKTQPGTVKTMTNYKITSKAARSAAFENEIEAQKLIASLQSQADALKEAKAFLTKQAAVDRAYSRCKKQAAKAAKATKAQDVARTQKRRKQTSCREDRVE